MSGRDRDRDPHDLGRSERGEDRDVRGEDRYARAEKRNGRGEDRPARGQDRHGRSRDRRSRDRAGNARDGSGNALHRAEEAREIAPWIGPALSAGMFGLLLLAEHRRPLRAATEAKSRRTGRNFVLAALSGGVLQLAEVPLVRRLARLTHRRSLGLLHVAPLPPPLRTGLGCLLLDWTLYQWHVLTHRVPFLWRYHRVHHVDLDLDASTAFRFHFVEMLLSVPWRAAQVVLIGVTPRALSLWYTLLFPAILFHHSNVRLPRWLERRLSFLLVTPRLHGVHHSTRPEEVNSNWSNGLTVWDYLHGTLRSDEGGQPREIGVPELRHPSEVGLRRLLRLPFESQRAAGPLPAVGLLPARGPLPTSREPDEAARG